MQHFTGIGEDGAACRKADDEARSWDEREESMKDSSSLVGGMACVHDVYEARWVCGECARSMRRALNSSPRIAVKSKCASLVKITMFPLVFQPWQLIGWALL